MLAFSPLLLARGGLFALFGFFAIPGIAAMPAAAGTAAAPHHVQGAGRTQYVFSGYIVSRMRMWVPRNAVLHVRLMDVSTDGQPVEVASRQRILKKAIPMPFDLGYSPARIRAGHRYALDVEIVAASGKRVWSNDLGRNVTFDAQGRVMGAPFIVDVTKVR